MGSVALNKGKRRKEEIWNNKRRKISEGREGNKI